MIAQDHFLLGCAVSVFARMRHHKTKWICVAIHTSVLMRRHAKNPVRRLFLRTCLRSYAHIVTLSSAQRNDLLQLGIRPDRITFIPFGVDVDFFDTVSNQAGTYVLTVGRDAGRDYATFLGAAALTKHPVVVVAGDKNIFKDILIPPNVTLYYNKSATQVKDLYQHARMVVVASKDVSVLDGSDCSGQTVILDSLAARRPAIATRLPWITDYFIPGGEILVVDPHEPATLAQTIDALWDNEGLRSRIATAGHVKVVANYTTKRFADALYTLMKKL